MQALVLVILAALNIYLYIVLAYVVVNWLIHFDVINHRNSFVAAIYDVLWRLTEPALRRIRDFVPSINGVDLSPIILGLLIYFLRVLIITNLL